MNAGTTIERGTLPDGTPYRIWRCFETGKKIAYIDCPGAGAHGKRRTVKWIRKTQREAAKAAADGRGIR